MRNRVIVSISVALAVCSMLVFFITKRNLSKHEPLEVFNAQVLIQKADEGIRNKDFSAARDLYLKALDQISDPNVLQEIRSKIEKINMELLYSPQIDEYSVEYVVQPNDTLSAIAKKYATTVALIKKVNGIQRDVIVPGQKLKVYNCTFSVVIDKSQNLLFLKRNGEVLKTYIVATGKDNGTPVGKFKIINKLVDPTWFKAGAVVPPESPENILGTRWMGFDKKGFGIHGSKDSSTLGTQVTQGCVRMRNEEVEELYDIIPQGTEVVIVD